MQPSSLKLSIIVPVYNAEAYLEETVDTILTQNMSEFELILVDDASNPETKALLKKLAERDTRIKVHTLEENRGVCFARNIGIELSNGKYILFIDADDTLSYFAAGDLIKTMEESDVVMAYLTAIRINSHGYVMHNFEDSFNKGELNYTVLEDPMIPLMETNIVGCGSGFMIENKHYQLRFDTNMRQESNEICSDWEFYIHAATKGNFARVDSSFVGYRLHAESMSRATKEPLESFKYILDKYKEEYEIRGLNLRDHSSNMAGIRFAILFRKRNFKYIFDNASYFGLTSIIKMLKIITRVAISKFKSSLKYLNPLSSQIDNGIHYKEIVKNTSVEKIAINTRIGGIHK